MVMSILFYATHTVGKVNNSPVYDRLPDFQDFRANEEDTSASVKCQGTSPFKQIQCQITLTRITKTQTDFLPRNISSTKTFFAEADGTDFEREKKRYCSRFEAEKTMNSKGDYQEKYRSLLKRACHSPQLDDLKSAVIEEYRLLSDTCYIQTESFLLDFKRESDTTFVAKPAPEGPCNKITVWVLEREITSQDLWKFSMTHVSSLTEGPNCEAVKLNTAKIFSAKNSAKANKSCRYVQFGANE